MVYTYIENNNNNTGNISWDDWRKFSLYRAKKSPAQAALPAAEIYFKTPAGFFPRHQKLAACSVMCTVFDVLGQLFLTSGYFYNNQTFSLSNRIENIVL